MVHNGIGGGERAAEVDDKPANFPCASGRLFRVHMRVGGTDRELVDPSILETQCLSQGRRCCCDLGESGRLGGGGKNKKKHGPHTSTGYGTCSMG